VEEVLFWVGDRDFVADRGWGGSGEEKEEGKDGKKILGFEDCARNDKFT
jgi:hypothetical protein